MALNRRHKAIFFVTLVLTGCGLLVGADLKECLGFMILGVAFAWAVGSEICLRWYSGLKTASGAFYPWVRLPLMMALVGALLGSVLLFSRANPVLLIVCSCGVGILVAPLATIPTRRIWLRIPMILLAGLAFLLGLGAMVSTNTVMSNQYAEKFGELSVVGGIALMVGVLWLSNGWKLILKGISAPTVFEETPGVVLPSRMLGRYVSVFAGVTVVSFLLALWAWAASSAWAYEPGGPVVKGDNNVLVQVAVVLTLALWPYHVWRTILGRESNSNARYLRRHRRTTAVAGMIFVVVMSLAITYGVQNGNDRRMVDNITAAANDLRGSAAKIGALKQRDLRTTADYIQAYSEIDALLPDFEEKLQKYADVYSEARRMDKNRGLVNTQIFYAHRDPNIWSDDEQMLSLLRRVDTLTQQEVSTIKQMAGLPEGKQVDFWEREFKPFFAEEDRLRTRVQTLAKKIQS